jgi:hypothetical protein
MTPMLCPNCSASDVAIRSGGLLQPFFVKRVFGIEPPTLASLLPHGIGVWFARLIGAIPFLSRLVESRPLRCDILVCTACDFVCPALSLAETQLLNLYRDYRSQWYNAERVRYEPSYRKIALLVGKSPAEHRARMRHVEAFLSDVPGIATVREVLDFAGADGRFIPPTLLERCNCTVYDVSEESPYRPGIRKAAMLTELGMFDYIQVCHVLEHVRQPKALMESILPHLAQGGLVYLEAPEEGSQQRVERLRARRETFPVHEHINLYTEKSLTALVVAVGLRLVKIETAELDLGWCQATILSAVAATRVAPGEKVATS